MCMASDPKYIVGAPTTIPANVIIGAFKDLPCMMHWLVHQYTGASTAPAAKVAVNPIAISFTSLTTSSLAPVSKDAFDYFF